MKLIQFQDRSKLVQNFLTDAQRELLPLAFSEFVDTAGTATARATYYNDRDEQKAAMEAIHQDLFDLDRGVYAVSLLLPGLTDFSRQMGVMRLLRSPQSNDTWLTASDESKLLRILIGQLPPQRALKMFGMLRGDRVNNARTRRLILATLLDAEELEFWSVKYRRKIATALIHAWGRRTASILRSVLAKKVQDRDAKEKKMVRNHLGRFVTGDVAKVEQCVRFVLGDEAEVTLSRLVAYREAKSDWTKGRLLPFETMEGIRSRFHQDKSSAEALELTRSQLTRGQQMGLQRKAERADVELEFDPAHYDPIRLYLYAFEMGMTESIREQLLIKSRITAGRLTVSFERVGILIDVSGSMTGHESQHLRPIASALALRDVLHELGDHSIILTSNGQEISAGELVDPEGDTSLAMSLVKLLKQSPDVVFVLSDGYENAPAGRFAETIRAVRQIGIQTPIHQFSPVFAAETRGIRSLSDSVPSLPVNKPDGIGLGLLKALMESDIERGIAALLEMVSPVAQTAIEQAAGKDSEKRIAEPQAELKLG